MSPATLGKAYRDGDVVVRQGELGDCMYVVQQGKLEVVVGEGSEKVLVAVLGPGEVFGEMALFTRELRSATVRSKGASTVLTVDKRGFLKRVQEDPTLAFRILKKMSERIQRLNGQVLSLTRNPVDVDGMTINLANPPADGGSNSD